MQLLGIDIGGTGIKGAPVDVEKGALAAERVRLLTPHPATPDAVAATVAEVVGHFSTVGRVGATFPAVIQHGVALTAANVDPAWIGTDVEASLSAACAGRPFTVLNDADAAGVAEMTYGAGKDRKGVVVMVTLGTGIGTAVFIDGQLVPNTGLGHIEIDGRDAESRASEVARERKGLTYAKWGKRLDRYFRTLEMLLSPDLFIVGGGVSKKSEKFFGYIHTRAELIPAQLLNEAGIVGAAVAASAAS
jgi:polyphosphate glucokinase